MKKEGGQRIRYSTQGGGRLVIEGGGAYPQREMQRSIQLDKYWDARIDPYFQAKIQAWKNYQAARAATSAGENVEWDTHWAFEDDAARELEKALSGTRGRFSVEQVMERAKRATRELQAMSGIRATGFLVEFANLLSDARGLSKKTRQELIRSVSQGKLQISIQHRMPI